MTAEGTGTKSQSRGNRRPTEISMFTSVRCLTLPASRKADCTFVRLSPVRSTCFALSPDDLLSADRSVVVPLLVQSLRSVLSAGEVSFVVADLSPVSELSRLMRFELEASSSVRT